MKSKRPISRRAFVRLCMGTGAAVAANPGLLADTARPLEKAGNARLVDGSGSPLLTDHLTPGLTYVFHYPYVSTPCFLIDLGREATAGVDLETESGLRYRWKGGVGPGQSIVAFSAICAHRMSYPTRDVSFIGYRHEATSFTDVDRRKAQREQVIYCCSEGSVYDAANGGRVLGGPASQPLAAVDLECAEDGTLTACGTYGGDMFERFFEGFSFQLSLAHGESAFRSPVGGTTTVLPFEEYTRNQRIC